MKDFFRLIYLILTLLCSALFLWWARSTPAQQAPPALVVARPRAQVAQFQTRGLRTTAAVGKAFSYTPTFPAGAKCTEAALTLGNPHATSQRAAATPTKAAVAKHPQRKPLTQLSQQSAFSYNATSGAITGTATRRGMAGFVFTCTLPTGQKRKIPVLIRAR